MAPQPNAIRCAVYTRKSSEHNLDLEFNSLDAQREACEAYIKSQIHEGWQLIPDHYDDGGISGGSLERPDLQRLLADIRAKKIDNVVVYKVDRLTRSLTDFAKLVDLFDAHNVSFVSVTQAFNTTNSMGRLTLNVLLSFAQFEREVIAERVRDKVAASKRKGLWMGGTVPLGFINQDKKLIIVPEDAETVRWIFQKYLALGSIGLLLEELHRVGLKTKVRRYVDGSPVGGERFGKGGLTYLLKNRAYIGELVHRGEVHTADHEPIMDRSLFDAVQAKMAANNVEKKHTVRGSPYLLTGLIFDSAGNRMSPTHSVKKGVRYRYYVSQAIVQRRKDEAGAKARIPAPEAEALVGGLIQTQFRLPGVQPSPELLEAHIYKVTVQAESLEIQFLPAKSGGAKGPGQSQSPETVSLPWTYEPFVAVKGVAHAPTDRAAADPKSRDAALAAIGKARLWLEEILAGSSFAEIAKREGKGEKQIRLLMPLAFVSPAAVQELFHRRQPTKTLTEMAKNVPLVWR